MVKVNVFNLAESKDVRLPSTLPRRTDEIVEALELLEDQIWYNRHKCWMYRISRGEDAGTTPEIIEAAMAAAKRKEEKWGLEKLGPWDDFEWGMLNGKMSALRWVIGEEWDTLDT